MNIVKLNKCQTGLVAMVMAGLASAGATAGEVSLKSADGTVNLTGEFVEFVDDAYVIRTALGDLRISASRVRCEGEDCPVFETDEADVRIVGSETIGRGLMPLMMTGYADSINAEAEVTDTSREGELLATLVADEGFGEEVGKFVIDSTSSDDAFTGLLSPDVHVGMSVRRILPAEARQLRETGAGNMISPQQERMIGFDSVVVVVHPSNPVSVIGIEDLRSIYSGEVTNWADLGGPDLEIKPVNRQTGSAARGTFTQDVFGDGDADYADGQQTVQTDSDMTSAVNSDPAAVGYVGYAFRRSAKPLDLENECGLLTKPDAFAAKTEEYALQRRLYLYNRADNLNEQSVAFLAFATSPDADGVIAKSGFVDLSVQKRAQPLDSDRARLMIETTTDPFDARVMREMLSIMPKYDRLSTTLRFKQGASRLDERTLMEMDRLISYLEKEPEGAEIMLVGFTDSSGAFEANRDLSVARARQAAFDLRNRAQGRLNGITIKVDGFGELSPTACNTSSFGQSQNRRVEVWLAVTAEDDG